MTAKRGGLGKGLDSLSKKIKLRNILHQLKKK